VGVFATSYTPLAIRSYSQRDTLQVDITIEDQECSIMITISLMGQLQTADGERDLACEVPSPVSVRQVIQRQGIQLRHLLQLIREKKVLVTINKKIASEDSLVQDGDAIRLVGHDGMGGTGLGPSM
jgi:sulfur-carrier protein